MTKRTIITLISILLAMAMLLTGFMVMVIFRSRSYSTDWGWGEGRFGSSLSGNFYADLELVNTQTIPLADIDKVDVTYISEDILLIQGEGSELVLREYMNRDDPELFAQISTQGGRLTIRHGRRSSSGNINLFGWGWNWGPARGLRSRVELVLPASYRGGLSLSSVSGDLTTLESDPYSFHSNTGAVGWVLDSLNLSTTSGDVLFGDITAGSFAASSVSGEIYLGQVNAPRLSLSTTSGDIALSGANGQVDASTISGSILLARGGTGGSVSSTSGDLTVHCAALSHDLSLSSVSGDAEVFLPRDASFTMKAGTTSGSLRIRINGSVEHSKRSASGSVGASPSCHLQINTTSGDISVTQES